ncbi:hypothetical protein CCACVL1_07920 [Corchorus capsularis]|uniref:Uncharacterized protein n=1 Tax=Corchorus capsularis TaxID=210143 RepID=A0A1R3J3E2_COCAP|nr:hypothetical protein CCACVL1_07920 [Corchorus capsularis]
MAFIKAQADSAYSPTSDHEPSLISLSPLLANLFPDLTTSSSNITCTITKLSPPNSPSSTPTPSDSTSSHDSLHSSTVSSITLPPSAQATTFQFSTFRKDPYHLPCLSHPSLNPFTPIATISRSANRKRIKQLHISISALLSPPVPSSSGPLEVRNEHRRRAVCVPRRQGLDLPLEVLCGSKRCAYGEGRDC